jgi:hypothetical protein
MHRHQALAFASLVRAARPPQSLPLSAFPAPSTRSPALRQRSALQQPGYAVQAPLQARGIVHIPALVIGSKALALLLVKKVAVYSLIKRYGVGETVAMLRRANDKLAEQSGINKQAHAQIAQGIDVFEKGLAAMDEADKQAEALWNLVSSSPEWRKVGWTATRETR